MPSSVYCTLNLSAADNVFWSTSSFRFLKINLYENRRYEAKCHKYHTVLYGQRVSVVDGWGGSCFLDAKTIRRPAVLKRNRTWSRQERTRSILQEKTESSSSTLRISSTCTLTITSVFKICPSSPTWCAAALSL